MNFTIATSLEDALGALAAGARPIAGGSDLVVGARQGKAPLPESLVAIDRIESLGGVDVSVGGVRLGALVTHAVLEGDATIAGKYTALADAGALVGSPATRNVGTLGGNVMNASPAMDTGAPLLIFGAEVELQSVGGTRRLPVAELWTGPGRTSARADELCTAIHLPARAERSGSAYVRLEYRRAMEIAVVGAAASVELGADGTAASLALALTAVAPTIVAVDDVSSLAGGEVDEALLADVAEMASARAVPISDLRASDQYRRHCIGVMARRAVDAAARRARGETLGVPVNRSVGIGAAS
ncbi:MAG TPA: FAD binding domain-containing protein [Ilumatobacteraceae bacterium]|nr:FAD binding domain-containing protein [Ilumatobacteraceae bacterium]